MGFFEGECQTCSDYIPGCTECDRHECTVCTSGQFPSANKRECMTAIPNCIGTSPSDYDIIGNKYHCRDCDDTYWWNADNHACETCIDIIPGCVNCHNDEICTDCGNQLIPEFDGSECREFIHDCISSPIDTQPDSLQVAPNGEDWMCRKCTNEYFWDSDSKSCQSCHIMPMC